MEMNISPGPGLRLGRKRSKNWEPWEVYLLIQAKKVEWERHEANPTRDRYSENSALRWKKIEEFMKSQHVNRDSSACKNRWDATVAEYKLVKDWDVKPGNRSFQSLSPQERKQASLPSYFDIKSRELLDSFLGGRAYKAPPHSLPFLIGAEVDEKETTQAGETSAAKTKYDQGFTKGEDMNQGSSGKKRRKASQGLAGVMAAFQDLSSRIMRIERENSGRAKEAHEMAKDAHALEKRKFEFQLRKIEREDERADKFVGVLGQIAEAFHKVAEKM
ncbi:protein MpTRIHELIX2 [Marchantia polymorpha subsp. ruderalis]|uniref:Myb-like domain-containing protein n=2 Tax=Marchantia polymorpha TaxID=3197 RepID=A0AAF6AS12_MARPO|nr:hypothetical protein MARPO_0001s0312 [Marchantia polymorpha]BBM99231.1 hypothetical protein Mp_1g19730 [Marchantia polymorpha subsp. ruderalis]PTQ50315.1 hypothetical protein MARPO_0001s0312 [Marchantia polymorpha]PTQ50316.1 hypothetical protein MARPO_0001s0312 [Marchantia polymorpha]BBM99232.1 hypothetical protein Mp_1g19730 [Marchantia polymorpha subsp. ruderalis]|eukprot:PTQ50314.1 hypothetical protein MARPO_0001s0312 [Marchantia polymorpha]